MISISVNPRARRERLAATGRGESMGFIEVI
jgi:hypothetical protein